MFLQGEIIEKPSTRWIAIPIAVILLRQSYNEPTNNAEGRVAVNQQVATVTQNLTS
jgi:hypothetical protein